MTKIALYLLYYMLFYVVTTTNKVPLLNYHY